MLRTNFFLIVYVTAPFGNDGGGGLQTSGDPANTPNVMAVASVDSTTRINSVIIIPNGSTIGYQAGIAFGGWTSTVKSTIVVNGQFTFNS
jgi:hypothetical protein